VLNVALPLTDVSTKRIIHEAAVATVSLLQLDFYQSIFDTQTRLTAFYNRRAQNRDFNEQKHDETSLGADRNSWKVYSGKSAQRLSMKDIGARVAIGAAWTVALRFSVRLIGLASTLILLRLLTPHDFGIAAMVAAVVATVDMLRKFGFEIALIQRRDANEDDYNAVWTMEIILACLSAVVVAMIAEPVARFYSEPVVAPLIYLIAASSVIHGFRNVGIVEFRKELTFDKEFKYYVSAKIVGFVATISLAFWLRSYWALIIGVAVLKVTEVFLSYSMHKFRPKLSLVAFGRLFGFSKWMFVYNIGTVLGKRGPDFIVGKIAGLGGLGIFSLSYEISNLPTSELVAPINRALLPGFSKISNDRERSRRAFVRVAAVIAMVALPAAFGIASTAELIGIVILGQKWLAAVPLLKVLGLCGAITTILSPISSAMIALGRPGVVALLAVCNALVLLPAIVIFMRDEDVYGAALAMLCTLLFFLPIYFMAAAKVISITLRDIVSILFRPLMASILMYGVVVVLPEISSSDGLQLGISVFVGAFSYVVASLALWLPTSRSPESAEAYAITQIAGFLRASGCTRLSRFLQRLSGD